MQDPMPENITGEKRVAHTVEHRVNWGYVAVAVAVLAAVLYLRSRARSDDLDDEPVSVEIGGDGSHMMGEMVH